MKGGVAGDGMGFADGEIGHRMNAWSRLSEAIHPERVIVTRWGRSRDRQGGEWRGGERVLRLLKFAMSIRKGSIATGEERGEEGRGAVLAGKTLQCILICAEYVCDVSHTAVGWTLLRALPCWPALCMQGPPRRWQVLVLSTLRAALSLFASPRRIVSCLVRAGHDRGGHSVAGYGRLGLQPTRTRKGVAHQSTRGLNGETLRFA